MKAHKNSNGKIDLYLGRDLGSDMLHVAEFDNMKELRKGGNRLLKEGAECANGLPAREYAFYNAKENLTFYW
jgi:hypothetical protein